MLIDVSVWAMAAEAERRLGGVGLATLAACSVVWFVCAASKWGRLVLLVYAVAVWYYRASEASRELVRAMRPILSVFLSRGIVSQVGDDMFCARKEEYVQ